MTTFSKSLLQYFIHKVAETANFVLQYCNLDLKKTSLNSLEVWFCKTICELQLVSWFVLFINFWFLKSSAFQLFLTCRGCHKWYIFSPTVYYFFPTNLFPGPPSLFPQLSNYCSDKNPNLSYYTGGHALNAVARFMTYPKIWNVMWGKWKGFWGKCAFCREKSENCWEKNIPLSQ